MLGKFLQFSTKNLEEKYIQEYTHANMALRKRAFVQILIFASIEAIAKLVLQFLYSNHPPSLDNLSPLIHCGCAFIALTGLGMMWLIVKNGCLKECKLMQDVMCVGLLGVETVFELPSYRINAIYSELSWIMRLECLMSGFKNLWRVFLGLKILWFLKSKIALIFAIFALEVLHLRLVCLGEEKMEDVQKIHIFYTFVALEYFYMMCIFYNEEKGLRMGFLEKNKEITSNNTLKFILNEIPQSIIIMDHNLESKYMSNLLPDLQEINGSGSSSSSIQEIFKNIIDLKEIYNNLTTDHKHVSNQQIEEDLAMRIRDNELLSQFTKTKLKENNKHGMITSTILPLSSSLLLSAVSLHDVTLFDLIKGSSDRPSLIDILKQHANECVKQPTIVIDCKYNTNSTTISRSNLKKALELKIALGHFNNEECLILIFNDTTMHDNIVKLEDDNVYKERLLNSISHELRTPLNGNLVMLENAIQDIAISPEVKNNYLLPAFKSGKFLMNIINDILDYSQLYRNTLSLVYTAHDIRDTIKDCVMLVDMQAKDKGIMLNLDVEEDVPTIVITDHSRLTQVLLNLLSNSVKYTYQGEITIRVYMKDHYIGISVEDTGIGIKEQYITELFKPFTKLNLNDKAHMNCAGIGLGLFLSNILVKYLGPSDTKLGLIVESVYQVGTKFSFLLEEKSLSKPSNCLNQHQQDSKSMISSAITPVTAAPTMEKIQKNMIPGIDEDEEMKMIEKSFEEHYCCPGNVSSFDISIWNPFNRKSKKNSNKKSYQTLHKNLNFCVDHIDELSPIRKLLYNLDSNLLGNNSNSNNNDNMSESKTPNPERQSLFKEEEEEGEREGGSCKCEKILIVDDDCFNLMAMESLIRKYQVKYTTAYHGGIAIDKIVYRQHHKCGSNCRQFAGIFMDCNMPIMDGLEATKTLKTMMSEGVISNIKIIGCTSYTGKTKMDECLEAGMDDVILKPLSTSKLEEMLRKLDIKI